jgi:molybdopterin converting factor subunit 1
MIDVKIKFFGPLRDIFERDELQIQVPSPHNGATAFEILSVMNPHIYKWKSSVRLAVNLEYTSFDHELKDGDEICFIPPVSGG